MKKLFDLVVLFLRRNLAGSGLLLVGFPLFMIVFAVLTSSDTRATYQSTVVNLDNGAMAATMLSDYEGEFSFEDSEAAARERIEGRDSDNAFVFPSDFTARIESGEVPEILHITRPDSTAADQSFMLYLQTAIANAVEVSILEEAGIDPETDAVTWQVTVEEARLSSNEMTAIVLITFSILYGSAMLGTDLVNQRKNKVLYRGLATPTKASTVLAANVIGAWVTQMFGNLVAIIIIALMMDFAPENFRTMLLMTAILCFYSVCQQLLFLRLFKNAQLSMMVGMMLAIIMMFLAMLSDMKELLTALPDMIFKIAYLSPFYWVMESFNAATPWIPAGILLLLSLALFVAGGFRVRDFAD